MRFILLFITLAFGIIPGLSAAGETSPEAPQVIFFHSLSCQHCIAVKNEFLPQVEAKFKGKIRIDYRDIAEIENYKLLLKLKEECGLTGNLNPPVIFFSGTCLSGEGQIKTKLIPLIESALLKTGKPQGKIANGVDLIKHFLSFSPVAVIGAGLIDGINPCAFTVIVFFMSFLALQGYRRRELAAIGIAFIFAVFLTYILIGVGIFNFLYGLKAFQLAVRIVNLSIGIFSIFLGILALYDLFKFKQTESSEGMLLQLPAAVKNQIHRIIGMHYRRHGSISRPGLEARPGLGKLVFSALTTGFLVSILEAICTGQVYLPTIVFVLKTAPLKLAALGYLLLYNLMFILPLAVIFIFALLGTTSQQFSKVIQKQMLLVKALLAVVFFSLGIFLILKI